ncbi:MAG: hypothetical protein ACLP1X_02455 [Polyangiaceae bacterium]
MATAGGEPFVPSLPDTEMVSSLAGCPTGRICACVPVAKAPDTRTLVEPPCWASSWALFPSVTLEKEYLPGLRKTMPLSVSAPKLPGLKVC